MNYPDPFEGSRAGFDDKKAGLALSGVQPQGTFAPLGERPGKDGLAKAAAPELPAAALNDPNIGANLAAIVAMAMKPMAPQRQQAQPATDQALPAISSTTRYYQRKLANMGGGAVAARSIFDRQSNRIGSTGLTPNQSQERIRSENGGGALGPSMDMMTANKYHGGLVTNGMDGKPSTANSIMDNGGHRGAVSQGADGAEAKFPGWGKADANQRHDFLLSQHQLNDSQRQATDMVKQHGGSAWAHAALGTGADQAPAPFNAAAFNIPEGGIPANAVVSGGMTPYGKDPAISFNATPANGAPIKPVTVPSPLTAGL